DQQGRPRPGISMAEVRRFNPRAHQVIAAFRVAYRSIAFSATAALSLTFESLSLKAFFSADTAVCAVTPICPRPYAAKFLTSASLLLTATTKTVTPSFAGAATWARPM